LKKTTTKTQHLIIKTTVIIVTIKEI